SASQPTRCELDDSASYCAAPELDDGGFMASETFYGLTMRNLPAVVTHWGAAPNSPPGWGITWYDPERDATYRFDAFACLSDTPCGDDDISSKFGPADMSPDNRPSAEQLAVFASSFVDVKLRP